LKNPFKTRLGRACFRRKEQSEWILKKYPFKKKDIEELGSAGKSKVGASLRPGRKQDIT
jgi:hypothetical protein